MKIFNGGIYQVHYKIYNIRLLLDMRVLNCDKETCEINKEIYIKRRVSQNMFRGTLAFRRN